MNRVFVTGNLTAQAKMLPFPRNPGIVTIEPKVANPFRLQKQLTTRTKASYVFDVVGNLA